MHGYFIALPEIPAGRQRNTNAPVFKATGAEAESNKTTELERGFRFCHAAFLTRMTLG